LLAKDGELLDFSLAKDDSLEKVVGDCKDIENNLDGNDSSK
jgi:hypothetical protein